MPEGVGYFDFSKWFEKWAEVEDFAEKRKLFEKYGDLAVDEEETSGSTTSRESIRNLEKV